AVGDCGCANPPELGADVTPRVHNVGRGRRGRLSADGRLTVSERRVGYLGFGTPSADHTLTARNIPRRMERSLGPERLFDDACLLGGGGGVVALGRAGALGAGCGARGVR